MPPQSSCSVSPFYSLTFSLLLKVIPTNQYAVEKVRFTFKFRGNKAYRLVCLCQGFMWEGQAQFEAPS